MFTWFTTEKAFVYKLLALFLLVVLIFGIGSHYAGLGSDPYGIVHFARHLARGKFFSDYPVYNWFKDDWRPGEAYFVLHGNYIISNGKLFCKYTIGYPLILAVLISLFGDASIYFSNIFFLLLLLWFQFKLAQVIFSRHPQGEFMALFSSLLLIVMINQVWSLSLRPSRDLSAIVFLIAGLFLGIRALLNLPRINYLLLFVGTFCLGFSATIRLPNVLAGIPAGLYLVAKLAGKVRIRKLILILIGVILCFLLALLPAFIQNQRTSGSPFKPPRPEIVEKNLLKVAGERSPPPLWIGFFPTTAPDTLQFFWGLYGPLFTLMIILGLISFWRLPEIKWLCLGMPLVFILFYSMWVHLMTRYMLIAQPFLILLAAAGCGRMLQIKQNRWLVLLGPILIAADFLVRRHLRYETGLRGLIYYVLIFAVSFWILAGWGKRIWSVSTRFVILSLVLFGLFLAKTAPAWFHSSRIFQQPEARQFGEDFDQIVKKGSVVFATKPVSEYIALFTGSYGVRPFEMGRVGVNTREGLEKLLQRGISLYLIDNSGWKRDAGKSIPLFREYYDLTPAGKLRGDKYYLTEKFGKPVCTLYKIEPWSKKELELEFEVPPGEDNLLLTLNLRQLWDEEKPREWIKVEINGTPLKGPFLNGVNYIYLPGEILLSPLSSLKISSDRPLPRRIDLRLQDLRSDYAVELPAQLKFPDKSVTDNFSEARLRDADLVRLGWNKTGLVTIPTAKLPETELMGEIKVKKIHELPHPIDLRLALNGEVIASPTLSRGTAWERIRFHLPATLISSIRGELEFTASPPGGHELSGAEERWGALFFESIKIKRWLKSVLLPTVRKSYYFLAFIVNSPPTEDSCPGPYHVLIDDRVVRSNLQKGDRRLILIILKPEDISRPVSRLQVVSPDGSCSTLIESNPVLRTADSDLLIDVGGEGDWAFIQEGFYPEESHLGRTSVRWTEETARLFIPLIPREGKEMVLSLKLIRLRPTPAFRTAPRIKAYLNGQELGSLKLKPEDGIYRWTLPGDPKKPRIATLTLHVTPWRPSQYLPTRDDRELGVMLDWVRLEYL